MHTGITRSFFYLAAMAAMAGSAAAASAEAAQTGAPLSAPAVAMIAVLAVCFMALAGLVVTLPAVKNWFRRVLHSGPGLPRHAVTGAHRPS